MTPSDQPVQAAPGTAGIPTRARLVFFAVILASVLGVTLFLATRHRPLPTVPLREVHRKNLELRPEGWRVPGQTKGFTGFLLDTYDDGTLKSRSAISNGLLHGVSQGWYTNAQQQVEEHFVAGTSHGLRTKWHPNGQKLSEVNIVAGKLQGTFLSWHDNGAPAEEVELTDGKPDGLSRAYFPSGFLKSQVTLRDGKVVDQQFYKDEYREPAATKPTELSSNETSR
jgi:antitoxin component YwqK of YwqJK toxin-antitoxin module